MFSIIKYTDFDKMDSEEIAEHKTLYFNPNCIIQVIMDYVLQEIGVQDLSLKETMDLCTEKGIRCNVNSCAAFTNGLELLKPKNVYYVAIEQNRMLKPILNAASKEYEEFMRTQKRISRRSSSGISKISKRSARRSSEIKSPRKKKRPATGRPKRGSLKKSMKEDKNPLNRLH